LSITLQSFVICVWSLGTLQLAAVRVKLNEMKDELNDCVQRQDFQRAAELKQSIAELEASRQTLISDAEPQTSEVRTEKVSVIIIIVVVVIIF